VTNYRAKIYGRVDRTGCPVVLVLPLNRRVKVTHPHTNVPYLTLARYLKKDQYLWSTAAGRWVCVHEVTAE
jgi:hypothetical protein